MCIEICECFEETLEAAIEEFWETEAAYVYQYEFDGDGSFESLERLVGRVEAVRLVRAFSNSPAYR
jgi:hypothetical protein